MQRLRLGNRVDVGLRSRFGREDQVRASGVEADGPRLLRDVGPVSVLVAGVALTVVLPLRRVLSG